VSSIEIPLRQPFNLAESLASGQAFRWRRKGRAFTGVVCGHLLTLRQQGDTLLAASPDLPDDALAALVPSYFRLDDDLSAIYEELRQDPRAWTAIQANWGLRLLRQDPWEALATFICSSASNIPRITRNVATLCRRYGERVSLNGTAWRAFPSPGALSDAGARALWRAGLGYRADYLADTARSIASGEIDLSALRQADYASAKKELLRLPGVGVKVADCALLFSLEKLNAFPVDRWVLRAVQDWYFEGGHVTEKQIHQWAEERFGPHAGYAQQYLFHQRRTEGRGATPTE